MVKGVTKYKNKIRSLRYDGSKKKKDKKSNKKKKDKKDKNKKEQKAKKGKKKKKKSGFIKISKKKHRDNVFIHSRKNDCVPCILHHMGVDEVSARFLSEKYGESGIGGEELIDFLEFYYPQYNFELSEMEFKDSEELFRELYSLFEKIKTDRHIVALLNGIHDDEEWKHGVILMKYKGEPTLIDVQDRYYYEGQSMLDYLEDRKVSKITLVKSSHKETGKQLVLTD